jgi:HSP20 family protein
VPEKALAKQPAKGLTPFKLERVEKVFNQMKEIHGSIARRAFELFEGNGRTFGHALEDWFRAEMELLHPVHINVLASKDALQVQAEVPGFGPKELEVSVEPRRLTITGKRETKKEEQKAGKKIYSERCADQILRIVDLPTEVDPEKVTATLKDGVLTFGMPKAAPAKKVKIESKVA